MKKPLVSVVMPAYRADLYLPEALSSVFSQTFRDWELLIVDDGNSPETKALVEKVTAEAAAAGTVTAGQVRYLNNPENLGAAASRNRGVREAEGKWTAFLDADDCWEKDKLEKELALARMHPEGALFFTGSAFMDETGKRLSHTLKVPERTCYRNLLKQNVISCSSVLAERKLLLEFPMPEVQGMHEDFAAWLSVLSETGKDAFGVNEPLLIYRVRASSQSGNKRKAALMNFRVYRYLGLSLFESVYYEFHYCLRGFLKWRKIR